MILHVLGLVTMVTYTQGQTTPPEGSCQCVNLPDFDSTVNLRETACGTVLKGHTLGACFKATGQSVTCELNGVQYTFYELDYNGQGQSGWIANDYLLAADDVKCNGMGHPCSSSEFVSREEWGARSPTDTTVIETPLSAVFVHHSAGAHCHSKEECIQGVQDIQNFHMDDRGYSDIAYNFLVGEDGRIYEGRGWDTRGAHARDHNSWSHGICVLGNFMEVEPDSAALDAVRSAMQCGVDQGKLTPGHEVFGHRDGVCTACPGDLLYAQIQTWPYFSTRDIPIFVPTATGIESMNDSQVITVEDHRLAAKSFLNKFKATNMFNISRKTMVAFEEWLFKQSRRKAYTISPTYQPLECKIQF